MTLTYSARFSRRDATRPGLGAAAARAIERALRATRRRRRSPPCRAAAVLRAASCRRAACGRPSRASRALRATSVRSSCRARVSSPVFSRSLWQPTQYWSNTSARRQRGRRRRGPRSCRVRSGGTEPAERRSDRGRQTPPQPSHRNGSRHGFALQRTRCAHTSSTCRSCPRIVAHIAMPVVRRSYAGTLGFQSALRSNSFMGSGGIGVNARQP